MSREMARPAMGVQWGGEACAAAEPTAGRREQAVPPALVLAVGAGMSFVDHVDQAAPRAPGRWTTARPRKGTTRRQGRLGSCFPRGGEYDCTRVCWFVCRRWRITTGVGEKRDG